MNSLFYKSLKYMIKFPNNHLNQLAEYLKLPYKQTHKLMSNLKSNGYVNLYLGDTYSVELEGHIFVKNYYKNILKDLFRNYLFQIILLVLSFLLGLLIH